MKQFKIDDLVEIKSWDELVAEFGMDDNDIDCDAVFTEGMKNICGKQFVIEEINDFGRYCTTQDIDGWSISFDMIKLIKSSPTMNTFEKLNIKIKDKKTGEVLEPYEMHLSTTSIDVKVQINKDKEEYQLKTLSCYKNFPEDDEFELIEN